MDNLRIGIISLFDLNNVNYGNRLQAYALNFYLNSHIGSGIADTVYFENFKDFKRTKNEPVFYRIKRKIFRDFIQFKRKKIPSVLQKRLKLFNEFSIRNIKLVTKPLRKDELISQLYNVYIVGSDVVWYQWDYGIRPIKLLDFSSNIPFKKISYAASFGNDRIPKENREELIRCFRSFNKISVREKSSLDVMRSLERDDAVHVMDPTLLLSENEWSNVERCVVELINKKYIFVYLLSTDKEDRINIKRLASEIGLPIVFIPFASGWLNNVDSNFGDYSLIDCSLEEWVWLIHNAAYVITDSFHGCAFSANFRTPFLITKRKEQFEMNNRMLDFLNTIEQNDKYVDLSLVSSISSFTWNFDLISFFIQEHVKKSKDFLFLALCNS